MAECGCSALQIGFLWGTSTINLIYFIKPHEDDEKAKSSCNGTCFFLLEKQLISPLDKLPLRLCCFSTYSLSNLTLIRNSTNWIEGITAYCSILHRLGNNWLVLSSCTEKMLNFKIRTLLEFVFFDCLSFMYKKISPCMTPKHNYMCAFDNNK